MSYVEQRRNPYKKDAYTDIKETIKPVSETKTSYTEAPDSATMEFIRNQSAPVAESMGIDPSSGKVITPFEALGYNPEEERKRREAEQRLNDWKKKESGWYNALSIVGDALTAAGGGNVWNRDANRTAAQADKDNQRLMAEQKAEDMFNRDKLREKELSYAKYLNDAIAPYLRKTNKTDKEYQRFTDVTRHGAQSGYTTSTRVVSDGGGNGSSSSNSTSYNEKDGKRISVRINSDPNNVYTKDYIVSPEDYNVVMSIVKQRYADILKNGSDKDQEAVRKFLSSIGAGYDKQNKQWINEDQLLKSGRYIGLDDNVRKKIREKTNNRVKFLNKNPFDVNGGNGNSNGNSTSKSGF